jgi:hypothetical protein
VAYDQELDEEGDKKSRSLHKAHVHHIKTQPPFKSLRTAIMKHRTSLESKMLQPVRCGKERV